MQELMEVEIDRHEVWLKECEKLGFSPDVRRYTDGTRTSQDAADQLGCDIAHIAKSIIFMGKDGVAVVVITSGSNKVDKKKKVKNLLGYKPSMAIAEYVLEATGYPPGGVPPFGHLKSTTVLMDEDLLQYDVVWGACGTADTVFPIAPSELLRMTEATVGDVKLNT